MRITKVDELTLEEDLFYLGGGGGGGFDSEAEATEFVNSLLALDNYNLDSNLYHQEDEEVAQDHIMKKKKIKMTEESLKKKEIHQTVSYSSDSLYAAAAAAGKKINNPKRGAVVHHWTKEEHIIFLKGVEDHGWGSWKLISEKCLPARTQYQLASHAQKYKQHHDQERPATKKRRRCTSIYDITTI